MTKITLFTLSAILLHTVAYASRQDLSARLIPDSLIQNANSVVRLSETTITVSSPSEAEYDIHQIVTVLNESGARELIQMYSYDQFTKITDFSISIYDKEGKLMNKHGLKDMKDYSLYDGFSLFNDVRAKYIQTNGGQYPMTIERHVIIKNEGFMDFPNWYIQSANQSVENASLTVEVPKDMTIHFKSYNTSLSPETQNGSTRVYTWSAVGWKAFNIPSESYGERYYCPYVDISPSRFEIAGYRGSLDSWSSYGKAMANMWKGKQKLPDDVVREIKSMVTGISTDREKISILYTYLQKNFHYVSVQIGIGGCVPFDAATVHSVKYGDCKALSNYMCAILDITGVRSHPVLINAGSDEHMIDTAFTSNHFNHVILCTEADGQPLWLECTSSALPAGELGTFTENRYGLMIGDSTGMIIATPSSGPDPNTLSLSHEVDIAGGKANISGSLSLLGEYRSKAKAALIQGRDNEQSSYIFTSLHVKQPQIFKLSSATDSAGVISIGIAGSTENISDFKTGNKLFLPSTFISSWYRNIAVENDRKDDLLIDFPFYKKEMLSYHLDSSISVGLPADFDLDNSLVYFHRKSEKRADNSVIVRTELKMKKHIILPDQVALLKESLQKVNKYLQQKIVMEPK